MSTASNGGSPEVDIDETPNSSFTYRDVRLLGQSSVNSALRVIALIDFDCFYAQCEGVRLGLPDDQPLGVQQFLHVIAINYAARAAGLKKVGTAVEAKQRCPEIVLQHVPTWREGDDTWRYRDDVHEHMNTDKSSLDYYRLQSRKAIEVVKNALPENSAWKVEKASIDEIFIDLSSCVHKVLTEQYPELLEIKDGSLDALLRRPTNTLLEWHNDKLVDTEHDEDIPEIFDWDDVALNIGSGIVRNLRAEIYKQLRYTCSAGIARNKVVAKLAAGHNKPTKQTVVRNGSITSFLSTYKFTKLRGLGGKLGQQVVKAFSTDKISDLLEIPIAAMQSKIGLESGSWIYRVIRGIEYSEVTPRTQLQSMLSAKTFTPSITGFEQADFWLRIFAADIVGRLEDQEGRRPKTLAVHHHVNGRFGPTRSKQRTIPTGSKITADSLMKLARELLVEISHEGVTWPCLSLSISVSDFYDTDNTSHSLKSFWKPQEQESSIENESSITTQAPNGQQAARQVKKRMFSDFQELSGSISENRPYLSLGSGNESKSEARHKSTKLDGHELHDPQMSSDEGIYQCPHCSEFIPAATVLEHLDWHAAVELQNQN